MPHPLHIVDVFAEEPLAGNQLAVVLEAEGLETSAMQRIAQEMNFSETTFVAPCPDAQGAWPVRIFTPAAELPFAGHPTLGTASVLRALTGGDAPLVELQLRVGTIPVRFEPEGAGEEVAWLRAPAVEMGARIAPEAVAAAVRLVPDDLVPEVTSHHVTAGPAFAFARVSGQEALCRAKLDRERLATLVPGVSLDGLYLFCTETVGAGLDLAARLLFDAGGAREDPATGSATAMLGAFLLHQSDEPDAGFSIRIEQGVAMGRPSLLRLAVDVKASAPEIRVGGRVFPVLRGVLL